MDVTPEAPKPLIDPRHPCQTPHRSFPRHYWVAVWVGSTEGSLGTLTNKHRCTTCGVVEVMQRFASG